MTEPFRALHLSGIRYIFRRSAASGASCCGLRLGSLAPPKAPLTIGAQHRLVRAAIANAAVAANCVTDMSPFDLRHPNALAFARLG